METTMEMSISLFNWRALPDDVKAQLADAFGIPKRAPVHVSDGRIVDDGFRHEDLITALSLEKLQAFTQSDSKDFMQLLNLTIAKLNENPTINQQETNGNQEQPNPVAPKRRGRKPGSKNKPKSDKPKTKARHGQSDASVSEG